MGNLCVEDYYTQRSYSAVRKLNYTLQSPDTVLTDNGKQFTSKFFAALCAFLGTKLITTAEYHSQANGQVERYNRTLVARLRHCIDERQQDWDMFVQPLTYAFNT